MNTLLGLCFAASIALAKSGDPFFKAEKCEPGDPVCAEKALAQKKNQPVAKPQPGAAPTQQNTSVKDWKQHEAQEVNVRPDQVSHAGKYDESGVLQMNETTMQGGGDMGMNVKSRANPSQKKLQYMACLNELLEQLRSIDSNNIKLLEQTYKVIVMTANPCATNADADQAVRCARFVERAHMERSNPLDLRLSHKSRVVVHEDCSKNQLDSVGEGKETACVVAFDELIESLSKVGSIEQPSQKKNKKSAKKLTDEQKLDEAMLEVAKRADDDEGHLKNVTKIVADRIREHLKAKGKPKAPLKITVDLPNDFFKADIDPADPKLEQTLAEFLAKRYMPNRPQKASYLDPASNCSTEELVEAVLEKGYQGMFDVSPDPDKISCKPSWGKEEHLVSESAAQIKLKTSPLPARVHPKFKRMLLKPEEYKYDPKTGTLTVKSGQLSKASSTLDVVYEYDN